MDKEESRWLHDGLSTAAMIFWSIVGRIVAAVALIWSQERQEAVKGEFSLRSL
jgi:hypothetical protein